MVFEYRESSRTGSSKADSASPPNHLKGDVLLAPTDRFMPTTLEGGVVAFDIPKDQVFILNEQASVVFNLTDGSRTVDQVIQDVAIVYEMDAEEVRADVLEALNNFIEHKMLEAKS